MQTATPGRILREFPLRFAVSALIFVAAMIVVDALEVPDTIARPIVIAAPLAATVTHIQPTGTPHRWRRAALTGGVHAMSLAAWFMLWNRWWGA